MEPYDAIPIKIIQEENSIFFYPLQPLRVKRDVQIRFFRHIRTKKENQILTIASFTFHTGFIPSGLIRVSLSDLEISKRDGAGKFPQDFSVDLQIDPPPSSSNEQIISYSRALNSSMLKCCKTLASYHSVRADSSYISQLEQKGFDKSLVFLALSLHNNDVSAAHQYLRKIVAKFFELIPEQEFGRDRRRSEILSAFSNYSAKSFPSEGDISLNRGKKTGPLMVEETEKSRRARNLSEDDIYERSQEEVQNMINDLAARRKNRPESRDSRGSRGGINREISPVGGGAPPTSQKVHTGLHAVAPPKSKNDSSALPAVAPPMSKNAPAAVGAPPPPPGFGGPPPPPPPPGIPGPPPPPGIAKSHAANENKIRARNPFRGSVLKDVEGSVWSLLKNQNIDQVELDVQKFEGKQIFIFHSRIILHSTAHRSSKETERNTCFDGKREVKNNFKIRPKFTTFLDPRRAQNVQIGLSRFHRAGIKNEDIFVKVEKMDSLTIDDLLTLTGIQPTDEELKSLQKFSGKYRIDPPLGPAESFFMDVSNHPQFRNQVLALLFSLQFPIDLEDVGDKLRRITNITKKMSSDEGLKILLKTILDLGNLTNYEYGAGASSYKPWMGKQARAAGFKIDGLARLADVKSADGKWNLMSFLVENVQKQSPQLLDIADDFQDVKVVSQYDIKIISETINNVIRTLKQIEELHFNDRFKKKLKSKLIKAQGMVTKATSEFYDFAAAWKDAMQYFAEDISEYSQPTLGVTVTGKKLPIHLYISISTFFEAYQKSVIALRLIQKENDERYQRLNKDIQITKEPQGTELVVSYEQMKELARKNQEKEYKEAAQLFKRASMLPPVKPKQQGEEIEDYD